MSSRKSEHHVAQPPSAVSSPESQPGAAVPHEVLAYAPEGAPTHAWWYTLRANWSIPFALLAVVLLGRFVVETRWFGPYNQRVVMLIGFNIILAVSLQLINGFSGQFSLGHAGFMAVGAYMAAYPAKEFSQRLTDP